MQFDDLCLAEKSEELKDGPAIEMLDPNAGRNAATVRNENEEEEARPQAESPTHKKESFPITRRDMVMQLFNIITAAETVELVK